MTKTIILLAALAAVTNVTVQHFELPKAKVTVRVVDENDRLIQNANISLGFGNSPSVKGVTDAEGLFTAEGRCDIRGIGCGITKDGYYLGSPPIPRFTERDETLNRWNPWDETYTAILRPIGKPVALYAKKVSAEIPVLEKPCGFDLESGDWVAPYGKGMKADFNFTLHQDRRGLQDYDVLGELTFKNPLDGLQEASIPNIGKNSVFKWERQAPENDYMPKFQLQNSWHKGEGITRSFKFKDGVWEGYFFRVRTVEQNGKIVSAHYGKIRGGIAVYPNDPKPKIVFTYYFNPTPNDRNLEWDMKKNLFGGLKDMESPREP
jgi:hypothetical protein